jgi:hypothetical protein
MLCRAVPLVPCWHRQMLLRSLYRCFLGLFRAFFFEFSLLIGLFSNIPGLTLRELPILSQKPDVLRLRRLLYLFWSF